VNEARRSIPIFPLSNATLFPGVLTPLHVFEPRYRQMVEDALAGERRIAMAVVMPDRVGAMAGDPPVFPVACAGSIQECERLADGRFLLTLLGTARIRIVEEPERPSERLYRVAVVEELPDPYDPADSGRVASLRRRVDDLVQQVVTAGPDGEAFDPDAYVGIDDATYVNALCSGLALPSREKQVLLEADSIPARFEQLVDVLEFAVAAGQGRRVPNSGLFH
jgi:Lon protease-like protein